MPSAQGSDAAPHRRVTGDDLPSPAVRHGMAEQRLAAGTWAAGLVLLVALWLATRPYQGITHDAELYTGQALARLHPDRFATDLYFAYGSQDGFTLFSALYAPLIAWLGPEPAHRLATLLGHAMWLGALVTLVVALFGRTRTALLAAGAAIVLSPVYSNLHIFRYGEAFTTPRLFAEAGVLLAIAAAVRSRWILSCLILLVGALVHPLMTLTGGALIFLLAAQRMPRLWLLAGLGCVLASGLALTGIEPFGRLLHTFEDDVFAIVYERCAFAFLSRWTWQDVVQLLPPLCFAAIGLRVATDRERSVLTAAALAAAAGVLATGFGADIARNVLITNLQCLRALWLLTLMGNAFAAVAVLRLPRDGLARPLLVMAMLCNAVENWIFFVAVLSAAFAVLALAGVLWEGVHKRHAPRILHLVFMLVTPLAALALALVAGILLGRRAEGGGIAVTVISSGVFALGILALTALPWLVRPRGGRIAIAGAALLLAGMAMVHDQRTDWVRFATSTEIPQDLSDFLQDAGTRYWDGGLMIQWVKLRSPSYYSCVQGSGIMFFPATARAYAARTAALAALQTKDFGAPARDVCPRLRPEGILGPTDIAQVASACRASPGLDAIVLHAALPGAPSRTWHPPVPYSHPTPGGTRASHDSFHLYRCADLR